MKTTRPETNSCSPKNSMVGRFFLGGDSTYFHMFLLYRSFATFQGDQKTSVKPPYYMDVSENNGTPKSSILMRFSTINHPFGGTPNFWKRPYRTTLFEPTSSELLKSSDRPLSPWLEELPVQ